MTSEHIDQLDVPEIALCVVLLNQMAFYIGQNCLFSECTNRTLGAVAYFQIFKEKQTAFQEQYPPGHD